MVNDEPSQFTFQPLPTVVSLVLVVVLSFSRALKNPRCPEDVTPLSARILLLFLYFLSSFEYLISHVLKYHSL